MPQILSFGYPKPAIELLEDGHPPAVTFEQADGSCLMLPYAGSLLMRYSPDGVKMQFDTALVAISGRNLVPVWFALRLRQARLLRATPDIGRWARDEDAPHIGSITVTPSPLRI